MHRAAPAGANLTNARTGGMVAPRGYADGTASVPGPSNDARYLDPSANARGQLMLNSDGTLGQGYQPAVLSGQNWPGRNAPAAASPVSGALTPDDWRQTLSNLHDAPRSPGPGPIDPSQRAHLIADPNYSPAYAFGAAARSAIASPFTAQPYQEPPATGLSSVGDFARGLFGTPKVPLSVPHAQAMLDTATGAAPALGDTYPVHVYGHNPDTGAVSDHVYQVQNHHSDQPSVQGSGPPAGSPEHAVANAHAYTPEGFHAATRGLSLYQIGLMSEIQQRMAQAHRTLQPYDPKTQAFNTLIGQEMLRGDANAAAEEKHRGLLAGAVDEDGARIVQPDRKNVINWLKIFSGAERPIPNYGDDTGGGMP